MYVLHTDEGVESVKGDIYIYIYIYVLHIVGVFYRYGVI